MTSRPATNGFHSTTATARKQWKLDRIIDECAKRSIRAISPWRDRVAAVGLNKISAQLKSLDVNLSGSCRGGFYPAPDTAGLKSALEDNKQAIDEATALNAPCLLVGQTGNGSAGHLYCTASLRCLNRRGPAEAALARSLVAICPEHLVANPSSPDSALSAAN